jgi:hypothetical protein
MATGTVKGITLVSSEFAKAPGAPAEGSGRPVKKSRGASGGQVTAARAVGHERLHPGDLLVAIVCLRLINSGLQAP